MVFLRVWKRLKPLIIYEKDHNLPDLRKPGRFNFYIQSNIYFIYEDTTKVAINPTTEMIQREK